MTVRVSRKKNLSSASEIADPEPLLRISEVARRVGISSSALRAWESLGLVVPQRTPSKYRLYSASDVRLLQRAIFLRRARGLNPAAIVHVLKRQGVVSVPAESVLSPGQRFRRLRQKRSLSLVQVARATTAPTFSLFSTTPGKIPASFPLPNAASSKPQRAFAWNFLPGAIKPWSRISFASSPAAAAVNPTRTKAKNSFTSFAADLKSGLATKSTISSNRATASISKAPRRTAGAILALRNPGCSGSTRRQRFDAHLWKNRRCYKIGPTKAKTSSPPARSANQHK